MIQLNRYLPPGDAFNAYLDSWLNWKHYVNKYTITVSEMKSEIVEK